MNNSEMPINAILGGLTKREYFAGLAMQGLFASDSTNCLSPDDCIKLAIESADTLLKSLDDE